MGKVDPMHPELAVDPLGILRPVSKLTHRLPLVTNLVLTHYVGSCYIDRIIFCYIYISIGEQVVLNVFWL